MMVFDRKIVVFTLEDPLLHKPSSTTQIVEHRSLAKGLCILFETLWDQAKGIDELSHIRQDNQPNAPGRSNGSKQDP
jgi:hypothetical protein